MVGAAIVGHDVVGIVAEDKGVEIAELNDAEDEGVYMLFMSFIAAPVVACGAGLKLADPRSLLEDEFPASKSFIALLTQSTSSTPEFWMS